MSFSRMVAAPLLAAAVGVLAHAAGSPPSGPPAVTPLQVPAADGSGEATLTIAPRGVPLLSWVEADGANHVLRFSTLEGGRWTAPRTAAHGRDWFVNWADRPSVVAGADGSLMAHWLANNAGRQGDYGYGIRFARSHDGGTTWRESYATGSGDVTGYSGFVSILPDPGGVSAVYLAPGGPPGARPAGGAGHEDDHAMSLRLVRFAADGSRLSDDVIDPDTCSCCPPAFVSTARGSLVAYRDRETGEVRDISVVRLADGRPTKPAAVHRDGWVINACPTNGPALAARGERVAVAWFTAAQDRPRVSVACSGDEGATFGAPVTVDGGNPVGWPAVALLEDGDAAVLWVEALGAGAGEIRLRRVRTDGGAGPVTVVTRAAPGRSTGIPQMVRTRDGLIVAWRDGRVRSALVADPARP
jgi:hypothetical protein